MTADLSAIDRMSLAHQDANEAELGRLRDLSLEERGQMLQAAMIWDAASLIVFKLMFFRRKDVADVEGILRIQRGRLDLDWVRCQLAGL